MAFKLLKAGTCRVLSKIILFNIDLQFCRPTAIPCNKPISQELGPYLGAKAPHTRQQLPSPVINQELGPYLGLLSRIQGSPYQAVFYLTTTILPGELPVLDLPS